MQIDYKYLNITDKIKIIKTFYIVYTEIFGQILPNSNLKIINKKFNKIIKQRLHIPRYNPIQFQLYSGIPTPSQRWELLKLNFLHKLIQPKYQFKTYLNMWLYDIKALKLPFYKELMNIYNKWFKTKTTKQFIEMTPEQLRQQLIYKQHKKQIYSLHVLHPLRMIQYIRNDYKTFVHFNYKQFDLKPKKKAQKLYQEMFINFNPEQTNKQRNICPLCKENIAKPIKYHKIVECQTMQGLRTTFWLNKIKYLIDKTKKNNMTHQYLFKQNVIETVCNIKENKIKFWRIICGANNWDTKQERFNYKQHLKFKDNTTTNQFYIQLRGIILDWIYKTLTFKNIEQIRSAKQKYNYINKIKLKHHKITFTKKEWIKYKKQFINKTDIIIGTDGSVKNNTAGIGIIIKINKKCTYFAQKLNNQTIYYSELFAIAKIPYLLKLIKINPKKHNIFITTDSLNCFLNILKTPKKQKNLYPKLLKSAQEFINQPTVYLIKVKAHINIKINELADILANKGRESFNNLNPLTTPSLSSFFYSIILQNSQYGELAGDWRFPPIPD